MPHWSDFYDRRTSTRSGDVTYLLGKQVIARGQVYETGDRLTQTGKWRWHLKSITGGPVGLKRTGLAQRRTDAIEALSRDLVMTLDTLRREPPEEQEDAPTPEADVPHVQQEPNKPEPPTSFMRHYVALDTEGNLYIVSIPAGFQPGWEKGIQFVGPFETRTEAAHALSTITTRALRSLARSGVVLAIGTEVLTS